MAMQLKENEYRCSQYGSGRSNSGPCGRRKLKTRNIMAQEAAKAAKGFTTVLFCSDQHRSNGSGCIGAAVRDLGRNALAEAARLTGVAMNTHPLYNQ